MPISAKLFKIEEYPNEFPIETAPAYGQVSDISLRTKVELLGLSEFGGLAKLNIIHDQGENYEGVGYSSSQGRIDDLIFVADEKTFPAFVDSQRQWLIAAYSSKKVFNSAFSRLWKWVNTNQQSLKVNHKSVDLARLKNFFDEGDESPQIKGGWFNRLNLLNVNVAYIGGDDVSESEEWDRYETNGQISALRLDLPNNNSDEEPIRIMLTKDATLFSYKHFTENEFLRICIPIFEVVKEFII